MPKDPDEIEDLPPSEQAEDDDQIGDLADDAGSSTVTDETPKDTLSVVRDVVAAKREAPEESGSSPEGEEATVEAADEKPADDENYTDVPFHKHKRFQHMLQAKKAAEADAVRYRNVEGFLADNNLDAVEAADGLKILGLAKTNPVEAWERIKPWVEKLAVAAGVIMPPDLTEKVQQGQMTRETAIEVSKARAQVQSFTTREQLAREQEQRRTQQEAQEALKAVALSWATDRQVKDPNFNAKMPTLLREITYLQRTEGEPNTPQGVKEQCERAYTAVNAAFRPPAAPVPPPRKPAIIPVIGGQVAGNPAAKPTSTFEFIRANRQRG